MIIPFSLILNNPCMKSLVAHMECIQSWFYSIYWVSLGYILNEIILNALFKIDRFVMICPFGGRI